MGKILWMIVAGAAGYLGYRKLQNMERGIRSEIARGGEGRTSAVADLKTPSGGTVMAGTQSTLEERIVRRVTETPGILQTELYMLFPEENRRILQEALKTMAKEGGLKRKREGATFKLFPA